MCYLVFLLKLIKIGLDSLFTKNNIYELMCILVGISYAQLKYEGFHKRTEDHCSILLGVFKVSLFIFYH